MTRRIHSFIWGGLAAAILIGVGIFLSVNNSNYINLAIWGGLGIAAFTLISCLILANNFVGDVIVEIMSWSFLKLPMLIFELDLDGIIWFLTVKLLFWILGLVLGILFGILAIGVGGIISIFVYPFALVKNIREE
ncbi:MAG: hypothetical protein E7678_01200 [Ruminococcaceae bacterium]|nr:hypothetical protein [Oscillospiraceae bacterium]